MKMRMALVFAVVLSLAGLPVIAGTAASAPTSGGLPFCLADASTPALPVFPPSGTPRSFGIPCGACSDTICQHANVGAQCGIGGGGVILRCGDNGTCSQDGKTYCVCSSRAPF